MDATLIFNISWFYERYKGSKAKRRMRMMYFSVNDTGKLGKRKSQCSYQESDALPLSYRRLVGTKVINLGS